MEAEIKLLENTDKQEGKALKKAINVLKLEIKNIKNNHMVIKTNFYDKQESFLESESI